MCSSSSPPGVKEVGGKKIPHGQDPSGGGTCSALPAMVTGTNPTTGPSGKFLFIKRADICLKMSESRKERKKVPGLSLDSFKQLLFYLV